jgi:rare lipoprotein A
MPTEDFYIMRRRFLMTVVALAWPLLTLLIVPGLDAPLAAHPEQPVQPIRAWMGVASWYGPPFNGRKTASGEPFDMFAATAAHSWLPFGSLVKVVNIRTGLSQLVRINDRGPNIEGRELDVSFLVADRLGMLERGLAQVRIELLEEPRRRSQTP